MADDEPSWMLNVPRDISGRMELLATKPTYWESLYFGAILLEGLDRTEIKWRDHVLGLTMTIGPVVTKQELAHALSERMSRVTFIVSNLGRLFTGPAQEAAFGKLGEHGDPTLIEHMGNRLTQMYEQLLDWADEVRSLRVPDGAAEDLREVAALFAEQPIAEVRSFIHSYVASVEAIVKRVLEGDRGEQKLSMELVFTLSKDITQRYHALLKRAVR